MNNRFVLCQITRGVAPARCIVEAVRAVTSCYNAGYELVSGMSAVEAKNYAVDFASHRALDLVLMEDDILAGPNVWADMLVRFYSHDEPVLRLATTLCRNGDPNTVLDSNGEVLYSGTAMVRIPSDVLWKLSRDGPLFECWNFEQPDRDTLVKTDRNTHGRHSDVFFWWRVRNMQPRPRVVVVGEVQHVQHLLNSGASPHELDKPCVLTVAERRRR